MRVLIATFFIVLFDQITKLYVKGVKIPILGIDVPGMPYQSSINVFGNFFKITFIENPGMAFGLQIGGKLFLSLFTIFATVLLIVFLYKNRNEGLLLRLALAFILGGAIGNLIDRVFYGKIYDYAPIFYGRVVDFLHLDFPNFTIFGKTIYSWPIFNIADIFVTIGFLMILFGYKKIFHTEDQLLVSPDSANESAVLNFDNEIKNDKNLNTDVNIPETYEPITGSEPKDIKNFIDNNDIGEVQNSGSATAVDDSEEKINEEYLKITDNSVKKDQI